MKKAETMATWSLSLTCECPGCNEDVDLLDDPDFWDGRESMQAIEHGTDRTNNLEVICPKCGHEFEVCCEY